MLPQEIFRKTSARTLISELIVSSYLLKNCWLPVSLSRRTPRGPVLTIPLLIPIRYPNPIPTKKFRNPVLYARELRDRMLAEGINRAELAKRLGVSRARVTQWLDLLELPEKALRNAEALGDRWNRQVVRRGR